MPRASRRSLPVALAVLVALAVAPVASAATFKVNDPTDAALSTPSGTTCASTHGGSCTLRAAVQAADNTGGASTITLPAGDYKLTIASTGADDPSTGDLDIKGIGTAITITGAGASTTIIDANHIDRAFAVQDSESLSISGVTIRNGAQPNTTPSSLSTSPANGGAFYNDGTLSVNSSALTGNSADGDGGLVYAATAASSTSIANSTITGSTSGSHGGVLDVASGTVTLTDDTITHNSSSNEGGVLYDDGDGTLTIGGGTLSDNVGYGSGGALYLSGTGTVSLSNTTLAGDSDQDNEGGAIDAVNTGAITISGTTISGASSGDSDGGAIFVQASGLLTVTDSTFDDDSAGDSAGGALYMATSDLSVGDSTFTGDEGWGGGAIYVNGSSPNAVQTITTSTFTDNDGTSDQAGAIYDNAGDLTVSRSTFTGNNASYSGGALEYDSGDAMTLANDTFEGNQSVQGGAIYFGESATVGHTITLLNDTIVHNSAYEGGGIYVPADANTIENTIVADNSGGTSSDGGGDCYGSSATDNAASRDIGGNIDSDGTCFSDSVSHDHTGVDPLLGPLSANGGPTDTDALLAGSPAIGDAIAGTCPASDQRGVPRTSACDSGAFQTAAADLAIKASAPTKGTVGSPLTEQLTVTNNGPGAATGVTVTDKLPAGTTYYSSSASQGDCTGTTTLVCALGTIDSSNTGPSTTATVTLVLIPSKAGTIKNTASVESTSTDPNAANNAASATTKVTTSAGAGHVAPVVLTGVASQIKSTSTKLSAIINPAGESTRYSFQLGTKTIKGGTLKAQTVPKGVVITVKGLRPATTYRFRIVAKNAAGTTHGTYVKFKTRKAKRR